MERGLEEDNTKEGKRKEKFRYSEKGTKEIREG